GRCSDYGRYWSAAVWRRAFDGMLPYAMALGVATEWARRFEGIYDQRGPEWYAGPHVAGAFSTRSFERTLSGAMTEAGRSMAASPRSSSGSGGGGSSGGGGGGGGGGSWGSVARAGAVARACNEWRASPSPCSPSCAAAAIQ